MTYELYLCDICHSVSVRINVLFSRWVDHGEKKCGKKYEHARSKKLNQTEFVLNIH